MSFALQSALARAPTFKIRITGNELLASYYAKLLKHRGFLIYSALQDVARGEFNRVIQMVCHVR